MPDPAPPAAIIDLRAASDYDSERPRGAVHFTLEDLEQRAYLLPPRTRPLVIVGDAATCDAARRILERAERTVEICSGDRWRQRFVGESGTPSRTALWEPAPIVVQAVEFLAPRMTGATETTDTTETAGATRTTHATALDVACGTGRNAVFLALQGLRVTGVDRLPDALERTHDLARRSGVHIETRRVDLEEAGALAGQTADCVVVVRYLDRGLFAALEECVAPGGLLVYETFTIEQLRLGHPRNPAYMLQPGELRKAFTGLQPLFYDEGWHDGAHTAQLIARRSQPLG